MLQQLTDTQTDFSCTDQVVRFAVESIVGSNQIVDSNQGMYKEKAIELLPFVCWEQSASSPFPAMSFPTADEISTTQNYGTVHLPDFYKVDRVQANIGGNINLTVRSVDGQTFFNSAQAYVSTYPSIFWWNNLELTLYLYPIPSSCILKVFGRRLICKKLPREVDGKTVMYPWLDPQMMQDYIFEFIAYSLSKALSVYYNLPWSDYKDKHVDNLRDLLTEKQEQSFIRPHFGPKLKKGRPSSPGSIFTLGKGPFQGGD
jgi:hypothetical protein